MGDNEAAACVASGREPREERDPFEVETAVNSEPAAAFARESSAPPSTIAEALIGHVGEQDERPTRKQPALELLALHEVTALTGNVADDLAVAIAAPVSEQPPLPAQDPSRNLVSTAIDAVPKEIDDAHTEHASATATTRASVLETDHAYPDRVAQRRGVPPIAEPYVRDPHRHRGWLIVSGAFSVACLAVAVCVVAWARGEVRRARAASTSASLQVAGNSPAAPAVQPVTPPSLAPPARAAAVASCAIHVTTNVEAATVYIGGIPHGPAPVEVPVACGIDTLVELRHPRYEDFKRSLSVADGTLEVEARLEREKTELTVWSDPPGATVTYNGHALGKTPLVTKVNRYERGTLWFRAPGREADWRKIVPKQPVRTVSVTLKPRS